MRKLIFILVSLCMVCTDAICANTCMRDNTVLFAIKRSRNPVSVTVSGNSFDMEMDYDFFPADPSVRTIHGAVTCNTIETNTAGNTASSSDANTKLRSDLIDNGTQCWCSLTGPVSSWWVFFKAYGDSDLCSANCATDCANAIKNNTNNFRTNGIYRAIW